MNRLKKEKQISVISALAEGNSIRSVERMTGVHRDTIMRLLNDVGDKCSEILDTKMRNLRCQNLQLDEIWTYVFKKQARLTSTEKKARERGDQWVWVALDTETKLVPAFRVGKRDARNAEGFISDLSERLAVIPQINTDGYGPYMDAIDYAFGGRVDHMMVVKEFAAAHAGPGRYSPPSVSSIFHVPANGNPDPDRATTSHVERQNLTMRMQMRRFTRLTNAFSKSLKNLHSAVALHFAHYNFVRIHRTLRVTPAMAAGVTGRLWSLEELIDRASN
jgi:IS1 family transposase